MTGVCVHVYAGLYPHACVCVCARVLLLSPPYGRAVCRLMPPSSYEL